MLQGHKRSAHSFVALLAVALVVFSAGSGGASSATFQDPDEATGTMDIKSVGHADTASTVTYTYESWRNFEWSYENAFLRWIFDFNDDKTTDGYIEVGVVAPQSPAGTPPECLVFKSQQGQTGDCSVTTNGRIVTVQVALAELQQIGLQGTTYKYAHRVSYFGGAFDRAPDSATAAFAEADDFATSYTHTLGASGTTTTSTTAVVASTTTVPSTSTTTTTIATVNRTKPGFVNDNTVRPGQSVTVSGDGFAANQNLQVVLNSEPIAMGSIRSNATGSYNAAVTVPLGATPGAHSITVSGLGAEGGVLTTQAAVTVQNLSCADFRFRDDAQAVLDANRADPHGLDTDRDGKACETLPRRAGSSLARTGAQGFRGGAGGLALITVGAALVALATERRRRGEHFLPRR